MCVCPKWPIFDIKYENVVSFSNFPYDWNIMKYLVGISLYYIYFEKATYWRDIWVIESLFFPQLYNVCLLKSINKIVDIWWSQGDDWGQYYLTIGILAFIKIVWTLWWGFVGI